MTLTDNLIESQPGVPSSAPTAFRRGISISHTVGQGTYYINRNRVTDHRDPLGAAARPDLPAHVAHRSARDRRAGA